MVMKLVLSIFFHALNFIHMLNYPILLKTAPLKLLQRLRMDILLPVAIKKVDILSSPAFVSSTLSVYPYIHLVTTIALLLLVLSNLFAKIGYYKTIQNL